MFNGFGSFGESIIHRELLMLKEKKAPFGGRIS